MSKCNAQNERIKRKYFTYLEEANRKSPSTIDQVAAAIAGFESSTKHKDFKLFRIEQAKRFKEVLAKQVNAETGKPLAKATVDSRLMAVKAFFHWLAGQPSYKSRISYSDSDYFNPSANDSRIAHAMRERPYPTLEQIRRVLFSMPVETIFLRRDRAVIAATLLTGARDAALASLSIKHFDFAKRDVFQDAREVKTKRRKTFKTSFFPVGDDIEAIVRDWIAELKTEYLFGPDDPAFPPTKVGIGASGLFEPLGLSRTHWKDAGAIRKIFKTAFEQAGLPYFHPHSIRHTLGQFGLVACSDLEQLTAWCQSYGHEHLATLLGTYAKVPPERQAAIFAELRSRPRIAKGGANIPDSETIKWVVDHLTKKAS
jgi:integrase